MSLRAVLAPETTPNPSVTVAVAARELGCDGATVRAMVRNRQLSGHKVGKGKKPGGVRVYLASIRAYQARHAIGGEPGHTEDLPDAPEASNARNPAHNEAMAFLRRLGAV